MEMIHSGPGNIRSGLDENGVAWAQLHADDGSVVQRFEVPVAGTDLDPYEVVRQQHSKALALHAQRETAAQAQAYAQSLVAPFIGALELASTEQLARIRELLTIG